MLKRRTLKEKIIRRIRKKKSPVLLRNDFSDLGEYHQVGYILNNLINKGTLIRIGYGLYVRSKISSYSGRVVPEASLPELAKEALERLGISTFPSSLQENYNSGKTTQIPTGRRIGVKSRTSRKIGYNGAMIFYERLT